MPLATPYGVLSGSVVSADLQNPDTGQWPHYHIHVATPDGLYDSAINLKSLNETLIEYRLLDSVDPTPFAPVLAHPDGWSALAQNITSGALDYVRHPGLQEPNGWTLQTGTNLIDALNYLLNGVVRIRIFGAAYNPGQEGVHDVHMNQGDPPAAPGDTQAQKFWNLDGIWQDGGLIFEYAGPVFRISVLQIKFQKQSFHTDNDGHVVPWHFHIPDLYVPFWRWPPENPLFDHEIQLLIKNAVLFPLAKRAAAAQLLSEKAHKTEMSSIRAEFSHFIPKATKDRTAAISGYLVKLGIAGLMMRR
jgi:Uncharacterized conserved protein (DUF2278)